MGSEMTPAPLTGGGTSRPPWSSSSLEETETEQPHHGSAPCVANAPKQADDADSLARDMSCVSFMPRASTSTYVAQAPTPSAPLPTYRGVPPLPAPPPMGRGTPTPPASPPTGRARTTSSAPPPVGRRTPASTVPSMWIRRHRPHRLPLLGSGGADSTI
jgi:hypothetical protein